MAFIGAFATGAFATLLATRWNAQVMGWLGLLGALSAPLALGALDGGGMAFLALAYAATVAVLVWQRWTTLAAFAFFTASIQWLAWTFTDASTLASTSMLVIFGVLTAALALGFEARRPGLRRVVIGPEARPSMNLFAVVLLVLNAAILAGAGWELLGDPAWLVALALAHIGLGLAATRSRRISRELALIVLAIGIVLANIAFASIATGLPLVIGWAVSSLPFAALLGARQPGRDVRIVDAVIGRPDGEAEFRADRILAMAGLFGQIALAVFQGLLFDARPEDLAGGFAPGSAIVAAATIAVVAWACARLAGPAWRAGLDALALAAVAHFTGLALEGSALTAALAAEALALAGLARRNDDQLTAWAALAFAGGGARARARHARVAGRPARRARRPAGRRRRAGGRRRRDLRGQPCPARRSGRGPRPARRRSAHAPLPRQRRGRDVGRTDAQRADGAQRAVGARGRRRAGVRPDQGRPRGCARAPSCCSA